MAKLVDVARAAGVSQGTASNVFNRPALVRPEVRERVEVAARELGYSGPDPKGRLLRGGKVNAIGVVMGGAGGVGHWFWTGYGRDFMTGVTEICDRAGANVTLISDADEKGVGGIKNAFVDGFILHRVEEAGLIEPAKRRRLPFVVMDIDGDAGVNSVSVDYRGGARLAARHLIDLGHRRFAMLSVLRESGRDPIFHAPGKHDRRLVAGFYPDHERLAGFADALADGGISIDSVPVVEAFFAGEGATAGASMLFDVAPEATAVLTMADSQAIAVLKEARRRNISVPDDVSITGFDDIVEAAHSDPPLTTIAQNPLEKGRAAARILFEGGPPLHVVLPVKLVVRGSTALPRR